jgi:hypothetical protein
LRVLLFSPNDVVATEGRMLLAIAGIVLIVGLLGFAAFLVGKEHLEAVRRDQEILGELPRVQLHSRVH